jgi:hypothetical protein
LSPTREWFSYFTVGMAHELVLLGGTPKTPAACNIPLWTYR